MIVPKAVTKFLEAGKTSGKHLLAAVVEKVPTGYSVRAEAVK